MSRRWLAYGIAAAVFLLDRFTKLLIQQHVATWDSWRIIPGFFDIVHTENPGGAFSLLADMSPAWRRGLLVGLSGAALVLVAVLLWRGAGQVWASPLTRIGLALILGGALGNEYDRILHGTVTDFLELYVSTFRWPAFNVADSAISTGACLVLLDMLRSRRPPRTA
jgi:signal peptidase II